MGCTNNKRWRLRLAAQNHQMYKSTWLLRIPSQGPAVRATAGIFWAAGILGCWFLEESKIKHSFKSSYAWWIVLYTSLNCQAVPQHTELPACRVKDGELRRGSGGAEGFYFEGSPQGGRKAEDELSWGNRWALGAGWSSRDCSPHYLLPLPGTRTKICFLAHLPIPPSDFSKYSPWIPEKPKKFNI